MKNPMQVLASVRAFVQQTPGLNAYEVHTYSAAFHPNAKNLREVMDGLSQASVLIAYTGSRIGSLGDSYHWLHSFSLFTNWPTVDANVGAVQAIINGVPATGSYPFLESVIDADCDPPADLNVVPHTLADSIEVWEINFSLRERL